MQSQRREDLALAELWVLAVKLAIPKLQNCALGKISQRYKSTNRVPLDVLSYVYENTTDRSPLWAFWVDKCAWSLSPLEHGKAFPKSLLVDLAFLWSAARELNQMKYSTPEDTGVSNDFVLVDDIWCKPVSSTCVLYPLVVIKSRFNLASTDLWIKRGHTLIMLAKAILSIKTIYVVLFYTRKALHQEAEAHLRMSTSSKRCTSSSLT